MKPILFSIGNIHIYGYGLMIWLGLMIAIYLTERLADKKGLKKELVFPFYVYLVLGAVIGGKVLYWITILDEIKNNPSLLLNLSNGFVVYGSIIGVLLAAVLFCKIKKVDMLEYIDLIIPHGALVQGFGRIGCFFAGCCYGMENHGPFAMMFSPEGLAPSNVPLFPIQLVSSTLDFAHFFILMYLGTKFKQKGKLCATYLILYSIGRFILEFFRGDLERGSVGILSTSQFISIFILIAGIALFYYTSKSNKKASI